MSAVLLVLLLGAQLLSARILNAQSGPFQHRCEPRMNSFKNYFANGAEADCWQALLQMPTSTTKVQWYKPMAGATRIPKGSESLLVPLMYSHGYCSISVELDANSETAARLQAAPMLFKGMALGIYQACIEPPAVLIHEISHGKTTDQWVERPGGVWVYSDPASGSSVTVRIFVDPTADESEAPVGFFGRLYLWAKFVASRIPVWYYMQEFQKHNQ